jgi:hypothetical protein
LKRNPIALANDGRIVRFSAEDLPHHRREKGKPLGGIIRVKARLIPFLTEFRAVFEINIATSGLPLVRIGADMFAVIE